MKKISCFSILAFISIIVIVSAGLSFNYLLLNVPDLSETGFVMLQVLVAVKYAAGIIILMPVKVNQLALGFLMADLFTGILSTFLPSLLTITVPIIITQITLLVIYKGPAGSYLLNLNTYKIPQFKNELLTGGL
ncbi:hypothetical protein [Mucilaginibacter polytrichastri]|uniref:Uncharacterized protein n=1 Tax=Mucilaginibacter polytrichastri TaxID=1302689 RepID=A0A1Q5ZW65_9SPHI|nr:hypothetical protein [Mucilaginibacter polytrichastri]OKS86017.1 hypothetical protein RG47T_1464 [Mucilaginibacter polytrichastri]SFS59650.1 hypothetical protein SAMN04487890_102119 [Mucilaginibacter polytrichastri]